MKTIAFLFFFFACSLSGRSQENQIRDLVDRMIQSMDKKDTAVLRKCFTPGAQFLIYSYDTKGNPRPKGDYLNDFLRQIALLKETEIEEKLTGWQCYVDDGIASVWAPYKFYYDNKYSHCGVSSIELMRVQGEWKITQISDTRRKQDCIDDNSTTHLIDSLINDWHHAAAVSDAVAFFGRMAEDGIYIGTDASERWKRDELETWSKKYFERKSAWNFKPLSRNITIAPGGQIAWFDELLDTQMGTCRSTGILELQDNDWKIIHYQLSIAVPNDKVDGYLDLIGKGHDKKHD